MGALSKALGKQGAEKLLADWSNCLISSHSELRLRRPDLSSKCRRTTIFRQIGWRITRASQHLRACPSRPRR